LERKATVVDIKKAFRRLAVRLHPDKNRHPGAEEAFKKLNNVKTILTNPSTRRDYDRLG
jgi:DnaJ homolog subfamily B member 12